MATSTPSSNVGKASVRAISTSVVNIARSERKSSVPGWLATPGDQRCFAFGFVVDRDLDIEIAEGVDQLTRRRMKRTNLDVTTTDM